MSATPTPDALLTLVALLLYATTAVLTLRPGGAAVLPRGWLLAAVATHTVALAQRWAWLGHGPFTTLHEVLSSTLWSLSLVFLLVAWRDRALRAAFGLAVPVLGLMAAWLLVSDSRPGHLPPTYDTPLLYLHAVVGKAYLGLLLAATCVGLLPWWRRGRMARADRLRCDHLAHRLAAAALVCDTLMLIVGAVWAQDAWGRWWAWDPLESWAFISWLALLTALHARATLRPQPRRHGWWLAGCFALAFLTFFGVPFVSAVPHQGAL